MANGSPGAPALDPSLVAEALRRVDAGQHRDDVARDLTAEGRQISVATIRRAQAAQKAAPAAPKATRARKPAPRRQAAMAKASTRAAAPPAPPEPIALMADTLDELRAALAQTKGQLQALAGKQGYAATGNLFDKLLKTMAAVERERRRPGEDLSAVMAKGAAAVAKIRQGAATVSAREADTGCCARCGGKLTEEQRDARRGKAAA